MNEYQDQYNRLFSWMIIILCMYLVVIYGKYNYNFVKLDNFANDTTKYVVQLFKQDKTLSERINDLNKRVSNLEKHIINNNEIVSKPIDCTECVGCYGGLKKAMKYKTINGEEMDSTDM